MPAGLLTPAESPPDDSDTPSLAEMLERYSSQRLKRGQIVPGIVVRVGDNDVIVDVGAKCEGIVPDYDLAHLPPDERAAIREGDRVMVYVLNPEDADDNIILSLARARVARDWSRMRRLFDEQQTIEGRVIDCNKGGVIVQLGNLHGFVPGSQLDNSRPVGKSSSPPANENERWRDWVGTTLKLKIIEVNPDRNRLILSERAALREQRRSRREKLLQELNEGDIRRGRVTNLTNFGAFVDLGGIDGLVHISELSWKRVTNPREVVQVGQEIEVYVLEVDRERQRVGLSLKRLQPDPWATIEERYQEGQLVEGVITRLTKWGAFARMVGDDSIEGLIHVSELDETPVNHPRDVLKPGQVVTLRVIGVDGDRRRLALSLKRASPQEYQGDDWQAVLSEEQSKPQSPLAAALDK